MSDPILDAALAELRANGAEQCSSIHSWRCDYPDRYGPCNCMRETAEDVLAAVRPLIEADVRKQVARDIERMPAARPGTWDGKVLVGRRMAAKVALGGVR